MGYGVVSSDWVVSVCSGAGVTGSGAARSGGVGAGATGSADAGAGGACRHILIGAYVTRQGTITIAILRPGNARLIFSCWRTGAVKL